MAGSTVRLFTSPSQVFTCLIDLVPFIITKLADHLRHL